MLTWTSLDRSVLWISLRRFQEFQHPASIPPLLSFRPSTIWMGSSRGWICMGPHARPWWQYWAEAHLRSGTWYSSAALIGTQRLTARGSQLQRVIPGTPRPLSGGTLQWSGALHAFASTSRRTRSGLEQLHLHRLHLQQLLGTAPWHSQGLHRQPFQRN